MADLALTSAPQMAPGKGTLAATYADLMSNASGAVAAAFEIWRLAELGAHYAEPCPDEVMNDLCDRASDALRALAAAPAATSDDVLLKLLPLALLTFQRDAGDPPLQPRFFREPNTDFHEDLIWEAVLRDMPQVSETIAAAMATPPREALAA